MHNSYPQLGTYNKSLGAMIYDDRIPQMGEVPQMGNIFSDIWGSITGGAQKAGQSAVTSVVNTAGGLSQTVKNNILSSFLDTASGQAAVEEAKKTWLSQQAENFRVFYVENKTAVNLALAGGAALILVMMLSRARSSGRKAERREREYVVIPQMAQAAPPASQNPRRRKRRVSRRKSKRGRK